MVDLHRSLPGVKVAESVWHLLAADTETLSIGGVDVQVLGEPARALLVALTRGTTGSRTIRRSRISPVPSLSCRSGCGRARLVRRNGSRRLCLWRRA